jgi:hypothetical protein
MSRLVRLALATLALSALPEVSAAQNSHTREGFWFNLGLGAGSLGCRRLR